MKKTILTLAALSMGVATSQAALISTLNFDDVIWTKTFTETGGTNDSTVVGGLITADKSGAAGGVQVTVTLNSTITTAGYENITLGFTGLSTTGGLEYNASGGGTVAANDGLHIIGNGVTIDTNGINGTTAETEFDAGTIFPTTSFSSDFAFDASVDDSVINSLTFTLRVNAGTEELSINNVQIFGDVVPEPSSTALLGLGGLALVLRRRRK